MHIRRWTTALAAALGAGILAVVPGLATPAAAHSVVPADPAVSAPGRDVLNWLAHLPNRSDGERVMSGYFAGYSRTDSHRDAFDATKQQVEEVYANTGQHPAVIACDYADGWVDGRGSTAVSTYCNGYLKESWGRGSLPSVSVHAPNPGGGSMNAPLADFAELTDPATPAGKAWHATLDQVAAGLKDLSDAGVPVLFRPLHEMNGAWFWWGGQNPAAFRAVWQDMFDHIGKKLGAGARNVIWVYAPNCGQGDYGASGFYPGSSYVDVVGLDCYLSDPAAAQGYDELVRLGKPFAFTEIGPPNAPGKDHPDPGFDYAKWTEALHTRFPETAYFLTWNSPWSPVRNGNLHGSELMNDPWVVNRGEIDLSRRTERSGVELAGFESGTQGWGSGNTTAGPWAVDEWVARGARSLKADIDLGAGREPLLKYSTPQNLTDRTRLTVRARTAPWGDHASGTKAKLYVRTGAGMTWYDDGAQPTGPNGTTLTLDLTRVPALDDVREIGVDFVPAVGATGRSAVYVDDLRVEGPLRLAGFETGTEGWSGWITTGGPWSVTEWAARGTRSLKADVDLAKGEAFLHRKGTWDVTDRTRLTVRARTAPWGDHASGTRAKLYVRTGAGMTWYDDGARQVGPDGVTLTLDLSKVAGLHDVREIGVDFVPAAGATGTGAVYLDDLTVE
ncbi:glycosyl hydrolase [Streptomyces sp. NPDC048340]|uniref:glycosyl hydrolase n=1 Tax=Streptomyces sp. NPDC048340 TaxID=3365537 RepID=UPI00371E3D26